MLTLEQYKSEQMRRLYQDVLCDGPVRYSTDLILEMSGSGKLNEDAKAFGVENLAVLLFALLFLLIRRYDGGEDPKMLKDQLRCITEDFESRWKRKKEA